uniref:Integrase, catalytic region, zinc finger, CCHC-type, peptidase aspartic, catalytic n=1 Tax=Tanacetum cinerariifolium TaxID=118510 RepID=A0A6L2JXT8_TANCI|nr:integrase, catalytic region, zinc finger, CCHC-type, peptidase aspartic, catalytic [Tanacetum cinerariifolium]
MIPEPGDAARAVPVPETFHVQTDDELTEAKIKQMEADDQAIQTIILGLPEDIYAAIDSCETAQEIWLRVQQMMKGSDIEIQEKKAKFNEWKRFTSNDGESNECYYHRFSKLMNDFKRNKHFLEKITQLLIAQKEEVGIQLQAEEFDLMVTAANLDEIEDVNANCISMANLQQALTSGTQTNKALVYDSDGSVENDMFVISEASSVEQGGGTVEQHPATVEETHDESLAKYKALEWEIEHLVRAVVSQDIMSVVQNYSVVDTSNIQTELEHTKERFKNCIIKRRIRVDITTKTRRPQPKSNTKNDRGPLCEPTIKRFSNSTFSLGMLSKYVSKHMTRNLKLLINFVWKFLGTVRFGNDHVAAIMGFDDL